MDESRFEAIDGPVLGEVVMKTGAVIPVSVEVMEDSRILARTIDDAFDRYRFPWKYADRISWPAFVPLPRLAAARQFVRVRRQRLRDAWSVLLGHDRIFDPEADEWDY